MPKNMSAKKKAAKNVARGAFTRAAAAKKTMKATKSKSTRRSKGY